MLSTLLRTAVCTASLAFLVSARAQVTNLPPLPDHLTNPPPLESLPMTLPAITNTATDPALPQAQPTTEAAKPEAAKPKPKPAAPPAFHGKVTELDKYGMTVTVASKKTTKTYKITSRTRLFREGKPAIFSDLAEGESLSVVSKKAKGGGLEAVTVRILKHADESAPAKKPAKKEGETKKDEKPA